MASVLSPDRTLCARVCPLGGEEKRKDDELTVSPRQISSAQQFEGGENSNAAGA